MPVNKEGYAIPCKDCPYLTERVSQDTSEEIITVMLQHDASLGYHYNDKQPCGGVFGRLPVRTIEETSPDVAEHMERCSGPIEDNSKRTRGLLNILGVRKKAALVECGELIDTDLIGIVKKQLETAQPMVAEA